MQSGMWMYLVKYEMRSGNFKFDATNFSLPSPDPRPRRDPTSLASKAGKKNHTWLMSF